MGAEQSVALYGQHLPSLYQGLDATTSASVPASPSRSSQSDSSQISLQRTERSNSLSVGRIDEVGRQANGSLVQQTTIGRHDKGKGVIYRSSSISVADSQGVVVVCPGPIQRGHRIGSVDSLTSSSRHGGIGRKIDHIPSFLPFIPPSQAKQSEHTSTSSKKVMRPEITRPDQFKLSELMEAYGNRVHQATQSACSFQKRILGVQNKIDYELNRLNEELKIRKLGSQLGRSNTEVKPKSNLNGQKQIDELVLQSTQICGLMDQATALIVQLQKEMEKLNAVLPADQQLPSLHLPHNLSAPD